MLTLRFKKRSDGGSALTLLRADGTSVWQRQERHARFFATHDLTHFAVETGLGLRHAFYGLVAEGWAFEDFGAPWPRGPLPDEALLAETVVGLLDLDRAQRAFGSPPLTAADLNAQLALKHATEGRQPPRPVSEDELHRVVTRRGELIAAWEALAPGETLELRF